MRKKLYFGHPKGTYDTDVERRVLKRISEHPDLCYFELINPNQPLHELRAMGFRATHPSGSSMPYFLAIARSCDAGVFLIFPDGKWGSGTFDEAMELDQKGAEVWAFTFEGRLFGVNKLNPTWRLSREETSKRNRACRKTLTKV